MLTVEGGLVVASLGGEGHEVFAVEVNAVVVDVVGVFFGNGAVEAGCWCAHVFAVHAVG